LETHRLSRRLVVVALLVIGSRPLHAQTLDQSVNPPGGFLHNVNADYDWAQTFTVGLSGQLTRVDVPVTKEAATTILPLRVEVRRTTASGSPTSDNAGLLASASLAASLFPTYEQSDPQNPFWISADLSAANLRVSPGDVLAIVLHSDEPNDPFVRGYYWRSYPQGLDDYPGGDAFRRYQGGAFERMTANVATDSGIRTYVLVPEPAAGLASLAAAFALLRRRRR
jgi:hypothetical protein